MERRRPWGIHTIHDLIGGPNTTMGTPGGFEVRAVPLPYDGSLRERLVCAWWVLTGRAYAVRWPEPGEFEAAAGYRQPKH